ncbi:MAG: hypothetical protein P8J33_11315 [Pirellulaceae bacterium]|nr:hypothetical protein [Pirellulaceae bacterium]
MKNLLLIAITAALMTFAASESQAQMFGGFGGYSGGNGFSGGAGSYYGGCGSAADPRLGYCLENDCYCSGNAGCSGGYRNGGGGCSGGYGNGCGGCGNNGGMRVRITVRRADGTSTVRTFSPPNNGCGCANSNNGTPTVAKTSPRRTARTSRYTASHRIPRATASAKRPSTRVASDSKTQAAPTNTAKYRYRF